MSVVWVPGGDAGGGVSVDECCCFGAELTVEAEGVGLVPSVVGHADRAYRVPDFPCGETRGHEPHHVNRHTNPLAKLWKDPELLQNGHRCPTWK